MKKLSPINILLFIHIIFNLFLQTLPITNVLSYDFAAVNGIWQAILASIITLKFLKNAPEFRKNDSHSEPSKASVRNLKNIPHEKIVRDGGWYYLFSIPIIPLLISIISTIFVQNCPICLGISFYFAVTIPAFIFGIILAFLSNYLIEKRKSISLFFIYLMVAVSPILEIYFNPQIYFYSPLVGFFPGTIYDEDISVTLTQLIYTSMVLLYFGSMFVYTQKVRKTSKNKLVLIGASMAVLLIFSIFKSDFGFATDKNSIEKSLGGKIESEHFEIIYPESLSEKEIKLLVAEHEYYYQLLERQLEISPQKITSFVFENREQKGKLFGARNADVAKTWLNQIYLSAGDFRNTLKHELVHIFAAEIGVTPFKAAENINFAMIEGFAMAFENDFQGMSVHEAAKVAEFSGYKIPMKNLFSGLNFFGNVSSLAYIYSGSFIKYLNDKYGVDKVKQIYGDIDFEKYYGKSIDSLQIEYSKFLSDYPYEVNKHKAQIYFGRRPLIKKICARYAAERIKEAGKYFSQKKYKKSEVIYREIFEKTNLYSSFSGLVNSLGNQKKIKESLELLSKNFDDFDSTSYQYSAEVLFADNLVNSGEFEKAGMFYNRLLDEKPVNYYKNFAYLRLEFLKNDPDVLKSYLNGSSYDKYQFIKQLNRTKFINQSIPIMINLSAALKEDELLFLNSIKDKFGVLNNDDIEICFNLIDYLMKSGNLDESLNLLQKCKITKDPRLNEKILEKELKINWMINYLN